MDDKERVSRIAKAVVDECALLLASDAFDTWKGAESIRPNDLVAVNNFFLRRSFNGQERQLFGNLVTSQVWLSVHLRAL